MDYMRATVVFVLVYAVLTFGYLMFRYFFSVVHSTLELSHHIRKKNKNFTPKISIVIPCYNEDLENLEKCIISACDNSYPYKEVIVVDDGSKNQGSWKTIERLQKKYKFKAIRFKKNKGKRQAMYVGFKKSTGDFVVTMDSDSVISSGHSLMELVRPFQDSTVGSVSGNIQVLNKDKTLMTKLQWARYWLAFHVEKSSQSPYNGVTCCPGPFSAYRKEYLMKYLDRWANQEFLGQKCTYGDDRGLTTLMLEYGHKVKFSKYALCLTNVPETFKQFTKQQIRWKKSFIRENYYLLKFLHRLNPFMKVEFTWFWTVFMLGFVAKLLVFGMLITGNYRLISFAIMIVFVAMLHYIYAFSRNPGRIGYYGVIYGFLNEFVIMWLFWYADFTLKETALLKRRKKKKLKML